MGIGHLNHYLNRRFVTAFNNRYDTLVWDKKGNPMTQADPLLTFEGRNQLLNRLMAEPPEEIGRRCSIQLLNLLCADRLPGNENLDILACLDRLDKLTEFIKGSIERTYRAYGASPDYSNCKYQTWMACLVTRMKQTFGVSYSPSAKADLDAGINAPFSDASEVFINGILRDDPARRWGTCSSIPVLVTAIARKLGYPVRLACAWRHLYCRWEEPGRCFNIEASNAMGMAVQPDEHYRQLCGGLPSVVADSTFHFRSLTPAEEFACFMNDRIRVLRDAGRQDEALLWCVRAMQFAPDDPVLPIAYHRFADITLKKRFRLKHPEISISDDDFNYPIHDLVTPHEASWLMTISGHYREFHGELEWARDAYEEACRLLHHRGNNEQRNLDRFLKKFGLPPRRDPPSGDIGASRRYPLACWPGQEKAIKINLNIRQNHQNIWSPRGESCILTEDVIRRRI